MANEKKCPHCGKPVPPTALGDLCPECMLKAGLATQTEGPDGTGPHGTKVVHPPPSPAEIAALFPQLEIIECLGRGGMGVVYKARQPRLNRFVALKILAREKEQDAQFTERFTREAQALARLNHPNIVTVYDFGYVSSRRGNEADAPQSVTAPPPHVGGYENTPQGHCYLVMEFVDGLNLRQLLQARKMPSDQALSIVPKICEALQYAHEQGVVHRDIKPENILLDKSGRVKIADFGIAKMLGDESGQQTLTGAKDAVGTPHYMAPEQIEKPLSVDHRADIYSLGVVFYEMLTGELPLGRFAPPSKKVQIDVRLDEVVLHALEKEPERRYQQASQVKTAVETIAATAPGGSPSNLNAPVQTAAQIEAVRHRLKIPARGLIAAAGLQLLTSLGLLIFAIPAVASEGGDPAGYAAVCFGATVFMVFAAIILLGATSMMKLRNYPFSVVASVVGAIAGPGAILGLPFGVWACVELIRPEARAAFAANRAPTGPTAASDSGKRDFALSQVKGPAIGLVVTGVLDWVLMAVFCVFISFSIALESPGSMFVWLPLLAMVLSGCIIYAGLKMMQLERRGWAMFGSVLAMLVSPGNLIGLPLGIWALVTLNRREVREAFAANRQPADKTLPSVPPAAQRLDHFWRFIVIVFLVIPTLGLLSSIALTNFLKTRNVTYAISQTIQGEVGRQLHQAGATYDSLQVTVAEERDSGTPFTVSYKGLRHFKYTHDGQPDSNWPASADGQFIMQYIGGSQWQGALGDTQFTVQAGTVDNINLPFIDDPPVIGDWQSVDFVAQPSDFNPDQPQWKRALFLKGLTFLANGRMQQGWLTWTKGVVMHHGDKTASRYEIREINGTLYMFFEWKSGDSTILGMKPHYYVLKKTSLADVSQLTQEGWQLWRAQKLVEAAEKFQQATQLAPDDANAWNGLGWAKFNSGKADEAEKAFQKAVSLDPNQPGALNGLGQIYLSQRKYDQAETYLLKAAPQAPAARYGLTRLYLLEGKFDQAEKWAQDLVDSGQTDELVSQMLQAAQSKHLSEGLRFRIEPPLPERGRSVFGPVIEQALTVFAATDLDASRVKTLPDFLTKKTSNNEYEAAIFAWMERAGVDFTYLGDEGFYGLTMDMITLNRDNWENYSPESLAESLRGISEDLRVKFGDSRPLNNPINYTYGFKTRAGKLGLLQITGFTDNPRGVKIRYKLVQSAVPETAIDPATGLPMSTGETGTMDPDTGLPVAAPNPADNEIDPTTGLPITPNHTEIDPTTGLPMTSPAASDSTNAGIATQGSQPLSYQWYFRDTNPPVAGDRMTFGPVVERFVESSSRPPYDEYSYLDLDTGRLLSLGQVKPRVDPFNVEQLYDWRQKSGADVAAQILNDSDFPQNYPAKLKSDFHGLVGLNTVLLPADKSAWDSMSPQAVVAVVAPVKVDTTRWTMATTLTNGLPATHLFRTSEGGMGILQITGFNENPPGVKIRYKLVQTTNNTAHPSSPALESADLRAARARLAELRVSYSEQNPTVQEALARIKELEWMAAKEPNAPADLREAKAQLAELRVDYAEQNPRIQEALARIKALEQRNIVTAEANTTLIRQLSVTETQAVSEAQAWLALIDNGHYSEGWKEASAIFQGAVTETAWENSMNTFRNPLGSLVSRQLKSAQAATELPGAPDGQYVVMQFQTSFANKKSATETVTFMLEKDGHWKAAGYYIK